MSTVQDVLTNDAEAIVANAAAALGRANEPHYERDGVTATTQRLAELLTLTTTCVAARDLTAMVQRATDIADERFDAGFDIAEVQRAFSVLEEEIWVRVVAATAPQDLANAIGLVGTVLGAGRDALARQYVARASHQHVPSLDLAALFRGGS